MLSSSSTAQHVSTHAAAHSLLGFKKNKLQCAAWFGKTKKSTTPVHWATRGREGVCLERMEVYPAKRLKSTRFQKLARRVGYSPFIWITSMRHQDIRRQQRGPGRMNINKKEAHNPRKEGHIS